MSPLSISSEKFPAACEVNFDGLIGPTHHFAGLAVGNTASTSNKGHISSPRGAALQGLEKMRRLSNLGLQQAVLPPVSRPDFSILRNLGFIGNPTQILEKLSSHSGDLISAFFSASSMWTANCATVSPSSDTGDGRVHLTPANLTSKFHRALEPAGSFRILKAIFRDPSVFEVHDPLFPHLDFGDEGAANHTRFCGDWGAPGLEFFVYGRKAFENAPSPKKFPARQTLEASQAVARLHRLQEDQTVFGQQNPHAIDAGVFHNDVVAVGSRDFLFYHEEAFFNERELLDELTQKFHRISQKPLQYQKVLSKDVSLAEAVKSYLFNSQILRLPNQRNLLLAPVECEESDSVRTYLENCIRTGESQIHEVTFVNLRESMLNGGGPACLRLRVVLRDEEIQKVNPGVFLNENLYLQLKGWVEKHYRDRLTRKDLFDPRLVSESEAALDELTSILQLGSIYPFQR